MHGYRQDSRRLNKAGHFQSIRLHVIAYYEVWPDHLRGRYQSFTEADMSALLELGYDKPFKSVEQGVPLYMDWLKR